MSKNFYQCCRCNTEKVWYRFPLPVDETKPIVCCICIDRNKELKRQLVEINIENRVNKLLYKAMANKMTNLRDELFDTLQKVKNKEIEIQQAKSVCDIAQVIINSVKVEIDFMKSINAKQGSGFMEIAEAVGQTNAAN